MAYILSKSPVVRLDMMVEAEFYPQLVGYMQRMGCTYAEERKIEPGNGKQYAYLVDIQGQYGKNIGELIGLFYTLEWPALNDGKDSKFYLILNPKKKGKKKNGCEDRKAADEGCNGTAGGESAGGTESGQMDGSAGDGDGDWADGFDIDQWVPDVE